MSPNRRIFLNIAAMYGLRVVCVEAEGSADGGNGVERDGMLKFAHGVESGCIEVHKLE